MTIMGYRDRSVLEAARERVSMVFDRFERVVVSVSGGKDSTALRHLALEEAVKRGRELEVFFLDQECEYQSTVDVIHAWMHDDRTIPRWFQVPLRMTNATSYADYWLHAWGPGEQWMREKDSVSIKSIEGSYPDRFYSFFEWYEKQAPRSTAFLIALRTRESFNRYRAVAKAPAVPGWCWTTKTKRPDVVRAYPIYDWTIGDVWKLIADEALLYNRLYDRLLALHGPDERKMRVSNLVHEQAFRCLANLQELEPATYEKLVARLGGVHAAALYSKEALVYDTRKLPRRFTSWRAYRDYLLDTTPTDKSARFHNRFAGQPEDEATYRGQVKQILTNDWENNVPVANTRKGSLRRIWWDRL